MAKAQEQRIAYLTYPVCAGITVTFSRGLSPHSAASPTKPARRPVIHLFYLLYDMTRQIARGIFPLSVFFMRRSAEHPRTQSVRGWQGEDIPLWKSAVLTLPANGSRWTSW